MEAGHVSSIPEQLSRHRNREVYIEVQQDSSEDLESHTAKANHRDGLMMIGTIRRRDRTISQRT